MRSTASTTAADAVVVDAAGEALLAGAAVDGDRGDADLLELAGEVRGGAGCRRPSRAASSRVTGTGTASTTCRTSSTVAPVVSHIMDEPPPVLTTLRTGQPMLMSMPSASPRSTSHFAAPVISSAFAAEDLHEQRPLGRAGGEQLHRLLDALEDRAGVDEVGGAEPDAAHLADGKAEGRLV